jgi:16S rRNA (adenine1518-N6/adenine1519-N6)-dimethyltransferase
MRARKRFGQHFLEPTWVRKLLELIDPEPSDAFLEIGAGRGALTLPLAAGAGRLVTVEIDRDLAAELAPRLPPNTRLVNTNILDADLKALIDRELPGAERLRIAGNLPYNVAVPILLRLMSLRRAFSGLTDATIMLQQEVANRIVARPGTKDYGVLTILLRVHAEATRLLVLPPGAFRPAPRVTSAVVRLAFHAPSVTLRDERRFEAMVRGLFTRRRKTVLNALKVVTDPTGLSAAAVLAKVGIDSRRRPETLEVTELAALADFLAAPQK